MDFSWLASVRGNFIWYFSTRTEYHQAKAIIQWNDGYKLFEWCKFYSVVVLTGCNGFTYSPCYLQYFKFFASKVTEKQKRNYMYKNIFMGA